MGEKTTSTSAVRYTAATPPSASPIQNSGDNPLGLAPPPGASSDPLNYNLGPLGQQTLVGSGNLFGLDHDVSFDDALTAFAQADPNTAAQIQQQLLISGFYSKGARPIIGQIRGQDVNALKSALITPARAGADVSDYLAGVAASSQQTGPLGTLYPTDVRAIDLADPNATGDEADKQYIKALGRKPTPEEKARFTAEYQSDQRRYYQTLYSAQDKAKRDFITADLARQQAQASSGGINARNGTPRSPAERRDIGDASGFHVDADTAHNAGTDIAGQYGLAVTSWKRDAQHNAEVGGAPNSDHLKGMAVDLGADANDPRSQDKLNAVAAWAKRNEGPGKLFRWVGWQVPGHYDHVHLSFNDNVTDNAGQDYLSRPGASNTTAGSPDYQSQRDAFLNALKDVESGGGNYDWDLTSQAGAKGAYQFMPGTWATAARLAGVDVNDHSPNAQDAAARALVDQYFKSYSDWGLVAVAWNGGAGTANRVRSDPTAADRIGDGNMTVGEYERRVLGRFAAHGGANGTGLANDVLGVPMSVTVEGTRPDPSSDAYAQARAQNPVEAQAHDMAGAFGFLTKALGGVVGPIDETLNAPLT